MFGLLKSWLEKKGLSNTLIAFILLLFFIQLGVLVHESSHVVAALSLGCQAGVQKADFFSGVSGINCDMFPEGIERNNRLIIIALAGPLVAFVFGTLLWFVGGKDAIERMGGIIFWLYSSLPSLFPSMMMSDMAQAIEFGLNPLYGWLIFILIGAFIAYELAKEVTEKEIPFA